MKSIGGKIGTIVSNRVEVCGEQMHYLASGEIDEQRTPLLFLHGNPTSAELWRGVMEQLPRVVCVAPDLIGMGRSSKPDIAYRFADHARFLDEFVDALELERVVIVGHDWGVALGADRIARQPDGVLGFAFLEGRLEPLADWSAFDEGGRELFRSFRTFEGARAVLEENMMIETILHPVRCARSLRKSWRCTAASTRTGDHAGRCSNGPARSRSKGSLPIPPSG